MQEVFVHGLLGGARHGRLLRDQRAVGIEAARPVAPAVVDVAALVPIPGDGVPVEPIAPADLAEARLQPELPVHVQLTHDVPLFQSCSFPPVLLGGKEHIHVGAIGESTLARLAQLHWCRRHHALVRMAQFILALIPNATSASFTPPGPPASASIALTVAS